MAIKEPKYQLIKKASSFEIREYSTKLIAEVLLYGDLRSISRNGFRMIAGYIFGDNASKDNASTKIKMTTPVMLKKDGLGWKVEV